MPAREKWLVILLRVLGATLSLAIFAVFLPRAWMTQTHAWLGLGDLPPAPIVEYLARTVAGMYAIHGGLILFVSRDVRRFAGVIAYIAIAGVLFGIGVVIIDVAAGLPAFWVICEGPPAALASVLMLILLRGIVQNPKPTARQD